MDILRYLPKTISKSAAFYEIKTKSINGIYEAKYAQYIVLHLIIVLSSQNLKV